MAGIGSAWGSREEMLHPRDRHGRFRKKWKMAASVVDALTGFLDRFQPHQFQSDQQAAQYTFNRRKAPWNGEELQRLHTDWDDANEALQAGEMDDTTKKFVAMMDRNMVETTDDLIVSQTVPTTAFGLTPQQAMQEDGGLEDLIGLEIADAGYSAANIGSELSHPPGSVTLRVAVPKGTRVAYGGRSPNDRGLIFDRDQPLVVTKVESDGRGGWYMLAIAGSGARTQGATAVAADRTHGRRGAGLTPQEREARVTPRMSAEERLRLAGNPPMAQRAAEQRGDAPAATQQTPAPAAAPASPQTPAPPAAGVPERQEPVLKESVGPGSPEGKSASEIARDAEAAKVEAENAPPPAPAPPSPAEFREATRDIPSPSAGKRRVQWNKAHQGIVTGRRDPADVLRELDTDVADAKISQDRIKRGEDPADPSLDSDIESMDKLADTISERYNIPRRGQSTEAAEAPTQAPAAPGKGPTPTPGAPSTKREAAPKKAAPKKAAKRAPAEVADAIGKAGSREEADAELEGMTGPELKAVADHMKVATRARATKAQMRQAITEGRQRQLDGEAIGRVNIDTPAKRADDERRLLARAEQWRGKERNDEERRIVAEADAILARGGLEKRLSGTETRSEMRKRTAGPGLTDEQKADIKAKAARTDERVAKEQADFDAKNKADLDPLLEAAGLQESDLDDLDKTGASLILGQVREKKISKTEGVRRLKASKSEQLRKLGDALEAKPRKAAPAKAAPKKAVPAKAAPTPEDAAEEAFKARVTEAGLPDRVTALRAMARDQKIRGFSTMNKRQLQSALLGDEVPKAGKIGVVPPKKMIPHLEAADSDQAARALLKDHTLADLKALAKERELVLPKKGATKPRVMDMVLEDIRGPQTGIEGRTPDTSLEEDLGNLGYIDLPGSNGNQISQQIAQVDGDDPDSLRQRRDDLEKLSKQYRKDGDKDAANMAQAAADAMGMRAQTISGVEEATPPVKRVAKKAAPEVPEGEAPEVERPLEKMLKPELLDLARREGAAEVRPSWSKAKILDAIKRNRRMDSSRGPETEQERLRRELGAVPGGAERDLGPVQGPLAIPDRAPTLEEAVPDTAPPAKKVSPKARKRVPKGSVAGPKAQEKLKTPARQRSFAEAWDDQGFGNDKSMTEIRERIVSGEFTPEEGVRRLESEISFNEEEHADLAAELRGMDPDDRDGAEGIHARQAELQDTITDQKKAVKFLREHARDEAPVTKEDLDVDLKPEEKAALQRVEAAGDEGIADLKRAAKDEGLGDIEGDTLDDTIQNIAKAMARRELANREKEQRARDRQASIDERSKVADALSNLDQMAQNGGSDKALQAGIRRLPAADQEQLTEALGDRNLFRQRLDTITKSRGLARFGTVGETVPYDPQKHDVVGDIAPGSPVLITRAGHDFRPGDGSTVSFKARAIPDTGTPIPTKKAAPSAPEAPATPTGVSTPGQPPVKAAPGTAAGRITTSRLTPGTRILVERGKTEGSVMPTTRKTGSIPVTVTKIEGARVGGRRRGEYQVTVRDDDGNELSLGVRPGAQTHMLEPAPKAALPAPARKDTQDLLGELINDDNPMSREEVGARIADLDRAQLQEMAKALGIPAGSRRTIPDTRRSIVEATVGRRLDSIAIRGFRGDRPGAPEPDLPEGAPARVLAESHQVTSTPLRLPSVAPKATDESPKRHNAELIGAGLDLEPKGADRDWLGIVQRDLDRGTDGRQIANDLRREADSQRTIHNIQEAIAPGTGGPAGRIDRMERMADRLEGVRPLEAPAAPAKAAPSGPAKREMGTMQAARAQTDALRDLKNGKSHAEVTTALRRAATNVGAKEHDPQFVRPLEFTPAERTSMKRADAKALRDLAAEIQAQGVAQRAAAKAAKKAAAPAKKAAPKTPEQDRKDLTGTTGELATAMIDQALERLQAANTPEEERDAISKLLRPELATLARKLGLKSDRAKSVMINGIIERVKGREAPTTSAERAVPSPGGVDESVPMQPYSKTDNMRMHTDSPTMGLVKMYESAGRNGSANRMLDLRRRATEKGGSTTPQQVVDELKAIRAQETDPKFQRELDHAIAANDAPMTPMPDLPANTPPAARELMERLHDIPYARKGVGDAAAIGTVGRESLESQLADMLRQLSSGELRQQPDMRIRQILTQQVHEMNEPSFRIWELADLLEPVTDAQGRRRPSPLTLALREMRGGGAGKA